MQVRVLWAHAQRQPPSDLAAMAASSAAASSAASAYRRHAPRPASAVYDDAAGISLRGTLLATFTAPAALAMTSPRLRSLNGNGWSTPPQGFERDVALLDDLGAARALRAAARAAAEAAARS